MLTTCRRIPPPRSHEKVVLGGAAGADTEDKFLPFTVIKDPSPDSPLMQVTSLTKCD